MMSVPCTLYVVIPVYNSEKYIRQTIASIIAQPYDKIEIVCVNDGSRDGSMAALLECAEKYLNVHLIDQQNAGVSAARNTGIEYVLAHCTADDYLVFLDADDLWAKDVLSEQAISLWGGADCVGYKSVRCTNDLSRIAAGSRIEPNIFPGGQKSLWCHGGYPMGSVFYACRMIQRYNIRFIDGLKYAEDGLFKFTCFFLAEEIRLIDQVLYLYRMNQSSAMHTRKYGIEYMAPIIRGYLQTGAFLKPYESETRGKASFCHVLAGVYAIEMMAEHYQQFRSTRELDAFLHSNPEMELIIKELKVSDLSENHRRLYNLYMDDQAGFIRSNHIIGSKKKVLALLHSVPVFRNAREITKYPHPNIYL